MTVTCWSRSVQDDHPHPDAWIYIDAPLAADQDLDRGHDPCLGRVVEFIPERVDGGCGVKP